MFSFVDVPGHEKFVKTMVAGAQGVDLVLFAVASDDSVMPQTREHLDILKLLGVGSGVIARTKSDLADAETGALVEDEIRALVKGSFLANAPLVAVSAVTGAGLGELRAALTRAARGLVREDRTKRVPRLFLDRAFTMKGFGPVVTGTLDGGRFAVEDTLTLFPEQRDVRVRRIEVHGEERREAWAGERTSLNLAGIERLALRRGQALAARGGLEASSVLTAEVTWLPSVRSPLDDGARLRVHLGTADVAGRVHRLGASPGADAPDKRAFAPGSSGFAQITLESPLPARPGDRFVLRRPSPVETVGGGRVLDAGRPRIRRRSGAEDVPLRALGRRRTGPRGPLPPRSRPGGSHRGAPRAAPRRARSRGRRSPRRARLLRQSPAHRARAPCACRDRVLPRRARRGRLRRAAEERRRFRLLREDRVRRAARKVAVARRRGRVDRRSSRRQEDRARRRPRRPARREGRGSRR